MTAKIKSHPKFDIKRRQSPRPKGISDRDFHKVYWPFIPVFITICLLLALAVQTVPIHHLTGRVLGYQTSRSVEELLHDTNIQRLKAGEKALKLNDELAQAAQAKADDMAKRNYWSHYTPQGVAPWSFVTEVGYVYQTMGENLAAGFSDDDSVVNAWMASPHHRDNILNASYSEVGFAYANNPNYTAAGGGPMTIVVAFYAQPAITVGSAHPVTIGTTTGGSASRVAAAVASNKLSVWAPAAIILIGFAAAISFIEKHRRYFVTAAVRSERYFMRHPATDIGLLIIIGLVFLLVQTAGYIQ
jgi:hypothetical protein